MPGGVLSFPIHFQLTSYLFSNHYQFTSLCFPFILPLFVNLSYKFIREISLRDILSLSNITPNGFSNDSLLILGNRESVAKYYMVTSVRLQYRIGL